MKKKKYKIVYNNVLGKIRRSHLVWYKHTGEIIKYPYIIHHKNGNTLDDRFKNLKKELTSKHSSFHNKGKKHTLGKHHTKETKEKISKAHKGKKFSEEHIKNLSLSHKGKKFSKETKIKMSISQKKRKDNNRGLGKHLSKEIREKISKNHSRFWKGKKLPKEVRDKIKKTLKAKWKRGEIKGNTKDNEK